MLTPTNENLVSLTPVIDGAGDLFYVPREVISGRTLLLILILNPLRQMLVLLMVGWCVIQLKVRLKVELPAGLGRFLNDR